MTNHDPEEWLRRRAQQRVAILRSERRRLAALLLIPIGLLGLALAPRLLAGGYWGAPAIAAQARPRAASLPPSKQSAPAVRPIWLCGTITTGGESRPIGIGVTDHLSIEVGAASKIELRRQDRPCGAAK